MVDMDRGNQAADQIERETPMTNATLQAFRDLAAAMRTDPADWQWIGPHMSQRMFGITEQRACDYAEQLGGEARRMEVAS